MRPYLGPPATLGTTRDAGLDLWGDCQGCRRDVNVDTAQLGAWHVVDDPEIMKETPWLLLA
jgi:hypothetical protein